MSGTHALFAPSKAAVWVNCYGALAFADSLGLKEETNIHAASGTLTHDIAKRIACGEIYPPAGTKVTVEGFEFIVDEARIARAMDYVTRVKARGGAQFYEQKFESLPWPGTSDAVVVLPKELESHDLKDGNGIVAAQDNEQLVAYLLLAWEDFGFMDDFERFRGYIHQPKANWFDSVEYTKEQMLEWKDKLLKAYKRGMDAFGRTPNQIQAALTPGDKQCKWCPARNHCKVRAMYYADGVPKTVDKAGLSDDELGALLTKLEAAAELLSDLRGEGLARAKTGRKLPGWKLATGRQGDRAWTDAEKVGELLYEEITAEAYVRSLISPAVAQKKLKAKPEAWLKLQEFITRAPGKETLVPESDLRQAIQVPEFGMADGSDLIGEIANG